MKRRKAREKAVQALFQISVGGTELDDALHHVSDEQAIDAFLKELVTQTVEHMEPIDELIKQHLINWQFNRVGNIDKAILRLAICEIRFIDEVPTNVSINEAVELAKLFGDEDTPKFINGVLAKIAKTSE